MQVTLKYASIVNKFFIIGRRSKSSLNVKLYQNRHMEGNALLNIKKNLNWSKNCLLDEWFSLISTAGGLVRNNVAFDSVGTPVSETGAIRNPFARASCSLQGFCRFWMLACFSFSTVSHAFMTTCADLCWEHQMGKCVFGLLGLVFFLYSLNSEISQVR